MPHDGSVYGSQMVRDHHKFLRWKPEPVTPDHCTLVWCLEQFLSQCQAGSPVASLSLEWES